MAIMKSLGISTGAFAPTITQPNQDRSMVEHYNGSTVYKIDIGYHNINPAEHIKWCRRNLGERNDNWDFWLAGGLLYVKVWGDKAKFTYEMWKT